MHIDIHSLLVYRLCPVELEIQHRRYTLINKSKDQWGPKLKAVREDLNLSQTKLGKILQVNQATVARWEKDETTPQAQYGRKMQDFMEMMENTTMKEIVKETLKSKGGIFAAAAITGMMFGLFGAYKASFNHIWPIVLYNPDLMTGINKLTQKIEEAGK